MTEGSAAPDWTPVRVERLFEKVASRIESDILEGRLRPGQRLPNESELGRRMGIGRSAVREALKTLELRGLLQVRRGYNGGTFVRVPDVNDAPFELHVPPMPAAGDMDLLLVRRALEPLAARLAAEQAGRGVATTLGAILARERRSQRFPAEFIESATAFHVAVAEGSGNEVLATLVESLAVLIKQQLNSALLAGARQLVIDAHAGVFSAVEEGDGAQAEARMTALLLDVHRSLGRSPRRTRG